VKEVYLLVHLVLNPVTGQHELVTHPAQLEFEMCEKIIQIFDQHKLYTDQPRHCMRLESAGVEW